MLSFEAKSGPAAYGKLKFGPFELSIGERLLRREGVVLPLGSRALDILIYLAERPGALIAKQELIDHVWSDVIVEEGSLRVHVAAIRKALGDGQFGNRYIANIKGRGYWFVGTVVPLADATETMSAPRCSSRLIKTLPRKGFRFIGPVLEVVEPGCTAVTDNRVEPSKPALMPPGKPSIAILPFSNLSSDPDQDYFADGMVGEITNALSRFKLLFVVARNSSFTYKGRAVDIKQVGRELGVRYVLEGSVRKAAVKIRIACQLIDAATAVHLWADQFEGDLSDIFALQDRITEGVVSAIAPRMLQIELDLAMRRPNNLSAYDLCLRALSHRSSWTRGGSAEALRLASRALEIDPRCGWAASIAGECHLQNVGQGWAGDPKSEIAEGLRLLRLALRIDGNDYVALSVLGRQTALISGDFDTARQMVDRAVALNPNSLRAWEQRGWTYVIPGQPEEAIRSFARTIRLSPFDPSLF
jgi:TolB-like protein